MTRILRLYVITSILVLIPSILFAVKHSEPILPIIIGGVLFIGFCWLSNTLASSQPAELPEVEADGTYVIHEDESGPMLSIAMNIPESEALAKDAITLENLSKVQRL